ncbi:MAG: bacillithiol biosynthesis cysteine-adding enzyme BshC [Candidatus Hydrogenedens sp.]|nr:bacillithiol biosynthesis cysteine-adding enzyme BshC [Candidatus Hydrogenedens sp.]
MNKLYFDYLNGKNDLREFYSWLPGDSIENFLNQYLNQREKVRGNEKEENKQHINIISGQQPALLGGPFYTFYKLATLINISNHYGKIVDHHLKPIFWVHSWDHDWEEACNIHFLTYDYQIYKMNYKIEEEQKGKSLYKIDINAENIINEIETLISKVKGSEYTKEIKEFLCTSVVKNKNIADWSTDILKEFFNDEEIIWFEPHKITEHTKLQNVINTAIENHEELHDCFQRTNEKLKQLGYKLQVHKLPIDVFFFLEENGYRRKLIYDKKEFLSVASGHRYTIKELKEILKYEPERFSPNLILRCLFQQLLFPCVMYIGGPAEIAYWAQLKDLFTYFNLSLPIIYPRKRAIIVPPKIKKWMDEFGIYSQLKENKSLKIKKDSYINLNVETEIEIVKNELIQSIHLYANKMKKTFHTDIEIFQNQEVQFLKKIEYEIERYKNELIKMYINKNKQMQNRINAIENTILPLEKEQERVFSPISFISEYGKQFVINILKNINIGSFDIEVIEL